MRAQSDPGFSLGNGEPLPVPPAHDPPREERLQGPLFADQTPDNSGPEPEPARESFLRALLRALGAWPT